MLMESLMTSTSVMKWQQTCELCRQSRPRWGKFWSTQPAKKLLSFWLLPCINIHLMSWRTWPQPNSSGQHLKPLHWWCVTNYRSNTSSLKENCLRCEPSSFSPTSVMPLNFSIFIMLYIIIPVLAEYSLHKIKYCGEIVDWRTVGRDEGCKTGIAQQLRFYYYFTVHNHPHLSSLSSFLFIFFIFYNRSIICTIHST